MRFVPSLGLPENVVRLGGGLNTNLSVFEFHEWESEEGEFVVYSDGP